MHAQNVGALFFGLQAVQRDEPAAFQAEVEIAVGARVDHICGVTKRREQGERVGGQGWAIQLEVEAAVGARVDHARGNKEGHQGEMVGREGWASCRTVSS
eukprot:353711-Chlamydomonas_euryale.AAC.2